MEYIARRNVTNGSTAGNGVLYRSAVAKACTTPAVLGTLNLMSGVMPSTKIYSVSKG
jgi:hypothetical protein